MKKIGLLLLGFLALSVPAFSQVTEPNLKQDYLKLSSTEETRYRQLISELRCVVCQNEDLADSTTPLAAELRQQVALKIHQQQSNSDIKVYLSQRYGEFILFKPSFSPKNYLLWLGPFLLVLSGLLWLTYFLRKRAPVTVKPLSPQERQRLESLLKP
jgi:cytochrome c-type biogenesis protein CcmH